MRLTGYIGSAAWFVPCDNAIHKSYGGDSSLIVGDLLLHGLAKAGKVHADYPGLVHLLSG